MHSFVEYKKLKVTMHNNTTISRLSVTSRDFASIYNGSLHSLMGAALRADAKLVYQVNFLNGAYWDILTRQILRYNITCN